MSAKMLGIRAGFLDALVDLDRVAMQDTKAVEVDLWPDRSPGGSMPERASTAPHEQHPPPDAGRRVVANGLLATTRGTRKESK